MEPATPTAAATLASSLLGSLGSQHWALLQAPSPTLLQPGGRQHASSGFIPPASRKLASSSASAPRFAAVTMAGLQQTVPCNVEVLQNICAGALARTLAQAAIHPLDTIKTRLQVTRPINSLVQWQQAFAASCSQIQLPGFRLTICNPLVQGAADLYVGLTGALASTLPAAVLFFATDELIRSTAERMGRKRREPGVHIAASAGAAIMSAIIRVPGDVLKHRVQAYVYPSVWRAAQDVYQRQGLRGLYCGLGATLVRDVPEIVAQFAVYEGLRHWAKEASDALASASGTQHHRGAADLLSHPMLLGAVAGAVAATVTTPLDAIKTQLQCQGVCSPVSALTTIINTRGMAGFTAGLGARVTQTAIMSSIMFTCLEAFKRQLAAHRAHQQQRQQGELHTSALSPASQGLHLTSGASSPPLQCTNNVILRKTSTAMVPPARSSASPGAVSPKPQQQACSLSSILHIAEPLAL